MSAIEMTAIRGLLVTALVSMLVACGGGGNASSSEPVVARGVITGLGSIWVNGVEYATPNGGSYSNDDTTGTIASYQAGQVVSLRGTRNSNGISGTANEVVYEAEIEGAADSASTVNGVTIITDIPLIIGTRYEVSGFWINDTTIQATFIQVDDDNDGVDEVIGFVEAVPSSITLTVHGVTYTYSGQPILSVGNFVEIHFDPNTLFASLVELEDDFLDGQDDGQEVEVEGVVNQDTGGCPPGADFVIDLTCIDWDFVDSWEDGLNGPDDLVAGLRVEAEGHFNSVGLLIAEEIKGRGNRVRISAIASNVDGTGGPGTLDLFGGAIQVTTQSGLTDIEDPVVNGGGFEIRGIRSGPTSVLAMRIKAESVGTNDHELRAEVDLNGADSAADTITVMGISSRLDSFTQLEDEDVIIAPGNGATSLADIDFFLVSIDDDDDASNGPRDEVEVRIDLSTGDGSIGTPYTADQVEIEREDD